MKAPTKKETEIIVKLLSDLSVDAVGISVPSTFLKVATELTRKIKKELGIPVIWGGAHPTIKPQECIEYADFILRGETEETLPQLLKCLSNADRLNVPGLWIKQGQTIKKNSSVPILYNLDDLPLPDFEQENKYYIENGCLSGGDPIYNGHNSAKTDYYCYHTINFRGCPLACSYCGNQALKDIYEQETNFIRKRSVEKFIAELKYAKNKLNPRNFVFEDACFGSDRKWLEEFCEVYKKELCVPFYCEMHPSFIDEKMIKTLAAAGMCDTLIGIQSGSERIRNGYFKRNVSDAQIHEKIALLKKYKVGIHYELITDNPFETTEDKYKTLRLLLELPRPVSIHAFSLNFLPETEITKKALASDIIRAQDVEGKSDRGARQFLLDRPARGKDIFWNYLYFFATDYFCANENIPGMRNTISKERLLLLGRSRILRIFPWMLRLLPIALATAIGIKKKFQFITTLRMPKKPFLFMNIFAVSVFAPVLIATMGPKTLLRLLRFREEKSIDQKRVDKVAWYVDFIMRRWPWRSLKNYCYVRSLILYYFLRKEGVAVNINFGINNKPGHLTGHGWRTLDAKTYLDDECFCNDFHIIYSFPPASNKVTC